MRTEDDISRWFDRLRAEIAAVPDETRAPVELIGLAETEFAYGLHDAARATLRGAVARFGAMHVGSWTHVVARAAELCGRLGENHLLEPELERGLPLANDPEVVKYQCNLRDCVRELAVQTGHADLAASLASEEWPGRDANILIDQCGLARWKGDASEVRRVLPLALDAVAAAGAGPGHGRGMVGYRLMRSCVGAGLLPEATDIAEAYAFAPRPADDLLAALWSAADPYPYERAREGWLGALLKRFADEPLNHQFPAGDVRGFANSLRRRGDAAGLRDAARRFDRAVAEWTPTYDWIACAVVCDLAVMFTWAGDPQAAADRLARAIGMFKVGTTGLASVRGSRSLIASTLSDACRDAGDFERAARFARRVTVKDDRRMLLVSAFIAGGQDAAADAELAQVESIETRSGLIQVALRRMIFA